VNLDGFERRPILLGIEGSALRLRSGFGDGLRGGPRRERFLPLLHRPERGSEAQLEIRQHLCGIDIGTCANLARLLLGLAQHDVGRGAGLFYDIGLVDEFILLRDRFRDDLLGLLLSVTDDAVFIRRDDFGAARRAFGRRREEELDATVGLDRLHVTYDIGPLSAMAA